MAPTKALRSLILLLALAPAPALAQEEVVKLGDLLAISNVGIYAAIWPTRSPGSPPTATCRRPSPCRRPWT